MKTKSTKRAQILLIMSVLSTAKSIFTVCLWIRLAENGVQGEQLARDLLSVSALPAAHRNQVLHPQRQQLLLRPLFREAVRLSVLLLQESE